MAKVNYQPHYEKFQKYDGSLRKYCDSRRPRLNPDATKSAFKRIKKGVKDGSNKPVRKTPKRNRNDPKPTPTINQAKAELVNLPKLPKGLKLLAKHQAFADEYLLCLNREQAYMLIYPKSSFIAATTSAWELLRRPEVAIYIEYHRSIARSRTQIDLQWINKRRKQIAGTDLRDVADFGKDFLNVKESTELSEDHSAAIKKVVNKRKYKMVPKPGSNGEEFEEIIEIENGIELDDRQKAMNDLEKSLNLTNSDNSVNSTNEKVQQWWTEFLNPPEGVTRLSALGFAMRMDSIKHEVPPTIKDQAKAELAVLRERSLLIKEDGIQIDEGISTKDLVMKLVKEAAKNGDRGQLIDLAKTMAAMKITDKKFSFNMFSDMAEMVGDENEIGWED